MENAVIHVRHRVFPLDSDYVLIQKQGQPLSVTFACPGTDVVLQLYTPLNACPCRDDWHPFLLRLVQPVDDVIEVKIAGREYVLCNGMGTALFNARPTVASVSDSTQGFAQASFQMFPLTIELIMPFAHMDLSTVRGRGSEIVQIKASDGGSVEADKVALISKSDVFKAMFEHECKEATSGIIEISDFPLSVVTEMAKFVLHDYCSGWFTHYDHLVAIADKYNIEGMKELADKKKKLLDRVTF